MILRTSTQTSKFELFQRLNTGGSQLSDQEMRSCVLVMLNNKFFKWIKELAENINFQETVSLTERAIEEQYDLELVLRFILFRKKNETELRNFGDIGEYLTTKVTELAEAGISDEYIQQETEAFRSTFDLLNESLGSESFKRFDRNRKKFVSGFLISAFEIVALGIGYNYSENNQLNVEQVKEKVRLLWTDSSVYSGSSSGIPAGQRVQTTIPLGRKLFNNENTNK